MSVHPTTGLTRLGTRYGGYVLPASHPREDWICYCGGIGEDASFELELIARYGCVVVGFDPTPRSVDYMAKVSLEHPAFRFMPVGLWSADTEQRFYAPEDPYHVSYSIADRASERDSFTAQCRSVPSVMAELGHERVDLLKLDVEGAEYDVLESVFDAGIKLKILLVEFHRIGSVTRVTSMVDRVVAAGYRVVYRDDWDVTFVG